MPEFRANMPLEFRPPEIRLPEELRAPLLKKPGGAEPSKIAEEAWTPEQTRIANVLVNAFKGKDSLDSNIREEAVSRPIGDLILPKDVKINTESRTISYTDPATNKIHEFSLPPALQINKDTKTITYTPPTFGATPAVLAAASKNVDAKAPAPTHSNSFKNDPVFQKAVKPLTPAELAQQAAAERAAQAAAAAAAQKATVAKENAIVAKSRPPVGTKKSENASNKPNETPTPKNSETADDIIAAQESMSQAIKGAINTQQNTVVKTQETQAATLAAGRQNVGTVVAAKGAAEDAKQQNQQGRGQAEFQQTIYEEATTVGAAKSGQGVPGKSKK